MHKVSLFNMIMQKKNNNKTKGIYVENKMK